MEQNRKDRRWLRVASALFLAIILLAALLPSMGGIIEGPPTHPDMRRWGPFLVFPKDFFCTVGIVTMSAGCTLFGIARRNACEVIGWCLYGIILFWMLFGG